MKKPLLDHSWKTIGDRNELSPGFIDSKITELDDIFKRIEAAEGLDVARNVTDGGLIRHALVRCKEHFKSGATFNGDDYYIFFQFASAGAKKTQEMIDENFEHLRL